MKNDYIKNSTISISIISFFVGRSIYFIIFIFDVEMLLLNQLLERFRTTISLWILHRVLLSFAKLKPSLFGSLFSLCLSERSSLSDVLLHIVMHVIIAQASNAYRCLSVSYLQVSSLKAALPEEIIQKANSIEDVIPTDFIIVSFLFVIKLVPRS